MPPVLEGLRQEDCLEFNFLELTEKKAKPNKKLSLPCRHMVSSEAQWDSPLQAQRTGKIPGYMWSTFVLQKQENHWCLCSSQSETLPESLCAWMATAT